MLKVLSASPPSEPRDSSAKPPQIGIVTAARASRMVEWGDSPPRVSATNLTMQLKAVKEALEQTRPRPKGRPRRRVPIEVVTDDAAAAG